MMVADKPGLPFRLIAIVSDEAALVDVLDIGHEFSSIGLGVMLRDPNHNIDRVTELAAYALGQQLPHNICLISNAIAVHGVPFVHFTSSQLMNRLSIHRDGDVPTIQRSGGSTHTLEEALTADRIGLDYITFGPVFKTPSKPDRNGVGVEMLSKICRIVVTPVFALGGIGAREASMCFDAGVWGIAAISLFGAEKRSELIEVIGCIATIEERKKETP